MSFTYKKATIEDIDFLTKTRICVLRAANQLSDEVDMSEVERQSYAYYKKALTEGSHWLISYLKTRNSLDQVVSAFILLCQLTIIRLDKKLIL